MLVVLAAATFAAFVYYGQPAAPEAAPSADAVVPTESLITVHVSGEAITPGLVVVARSARVADAIAAAGGTTGDADLTTINLASPVRDGEQIVVPSRVAAGPAGAGAGGKVHLNTATAGQFEEIPGVGPVLAERIVAVRSELGGFTAVEDLLDVPGIGETKLAAMRDMVVVP